jgi:hypothetical protein
MKFSRHRRGVSQAVSRRPLTAEARDRSQASSCEICGGRSGNGRRSSPSIFGFPLSVQFHQYSIRIFLCLMFLPERQIGEAWEPSKKQHSIGNRGALDITVLSLYRLHFRYLGCPLSTSIYQSAIHIFMFKRTLTET